MSTYRQHLDLLLQASEDQLAQILDSAIAAIVRFRVLDDRSWEYEYFSTGCEAIFGYSIAEFMANAQLWDSRVHPDDWTLLTSYLFDDFFAERNTTAEYRFHHKDGSLRWISSLYSSHRVDEETWLVTVVNHDITDRKQAELNLREMSVALSNAVEGISRLDVQGRYRSVNEAYARSLGYTPDEMIGMDWRTTVHPEDLEQAIAVYRQMLSQGKADLETRGGRKDGSVFDKFILLVAAYDEQQQFTGHHCFMNDITDKKQLEAKRKRAEAELKQREQTFRAIFNSTFEFMGLLTIDGVLIEVNSAALAIINAKREDTLGQYFWDTPWWSSVPEEHERLRETVRRAAQGEFVRFEARYTRADGKTAFVDFSMKPVLDDRGHVVMLVPEGRDITDRKRAEEELRNSEARYRLLFESNPNPIWVFDRETLAFLAVNPAAVKHYGYSQTEFLGMTVLNLCPAEDLSTLQLVLQDFSSKQTYSGTWQHRRRDGSVIDVEIRAHPFAQGDRPVCLVLVNDITERLKAERQIRQQAALLDIASDAIFVRDLRHRILYWNQGAERLYGWQAEEACGQNASHLLQENPLQVMEIMQILLAQGDWQGELAKVTSAGKDVVVAARWTLVQDEMGRPKSILTVDTDITEKKQLEAQFYRAQRLESLGTLAGGIAHDLNNVLTPILTIAQLLRLQATPLDGRSLEMLTILEDSARRGADMVRQILTFTRGTGGDRITLEVAPLLQAVMTVVQQTFPKSIRICPAIPDLAPWLVSADPTYLHQVLMNLCVNARDAALSGLPSNRDMMLDAGAGLFLSKPYAVKDLLQCIYDIANA
ncbi:MAG: hypothetical protein OHK0037_31520 [Elainellaceae cyanobacterium]